MPRPARDLPEDFAEKAKVLSFEELCRHYNAGTSTTIKWRKMVGVARCDRAARGTEPKRPMPDDFRAFAPGRGLVELMKHYRAGSDAIARWRKEAEITPTVIVRTTYRKVAMPDNFARLAPTMTMPAARGFFGVGEHVLQRWCAEAGVSLKRVQVYRHPGSRPVISETTRDQSLAGRAADFLQKLAPIHRCDADGTANKNGTHWRRNLRVMTAEEVVERAKSLGFDPDAWKRLPVAA